MAQIKVTSKFNPSPYPYVMSNGRPKRGNYCRDCGHVLKDDESIARGYGPECWSSIPVIIVLDIQSEQNSIPTIGDSVLLDCYFCGDKFFAIPESALQGWDGDTPIYACPSCEAAQEHETNE